MDLHTGRFDKVRALLARPPGWKPMLWGKLEGTPLPDILNILSHGRRSGLLLVQREDEERALGFIKGDVTFAASTVASERDDAREVVLGLLRDQFGTFTFLRGPEALLKNDAPLSAQELLLGGLCRLDEEAPRQASGDQHAG